LRPRRRLAPPFKVIILTPSVRAISLCGFPCVTRSFACASFVAISTLECRFLAVAACIRPSPRGIPEINVVDYGDDWPLELSSVDSDRFRNVAGLTSIEKY